MGMTSEERAYRSYLSTELKKQGYKTYGELLELFELWLTDDPNCIGRIYPGRARIEINRDATEEHQQLLTIRHEIMHEYLSHEIRLLDHIAKKYPEYASDKATLKQILYGYRLGQYTVANIAGDFEISNLAYTDQDKDDMRHIKFNGQIVSGLVTEDQHPDWVNLTVEEMFDKIIDEAEKKEPGDQIDPGDKGDTGNSPNEPGNDGGSGGGHGPSKKVKVITGTLTGGRFYDDDGNDVTPEG